MSDRRRGDRYDSLSPEPYIIERKPRNLSSSPFPQRRVSFASTFNPFKRDKHTVIIKESTVRRRRTHQPSRSPSPSPLPPRRPYHIMDARSSEDFVPLPKKLPTKQEEERSSSSEGGDHNKGGRRRKPKIIHGPHPEDERAYPVVESPGSGPSPRRRDSGVFSIEGSPRARQYVDEHGRPTFPPSYDQGHRDGAQHASQTLQDALMKERLDRIEAEKAAVRAKEEATEAKAELERYKRQSWLDDRERKVGDREQQFRDEQRRITDAPVRQPREVVVSQPKPPVRFVDEAEDAMRRARNDEKRRSGGGRGGGAY